MSELLDTTQKVDRALEELFSREALYSEKRLAAGEAEYQYRLAKAVAFKKAEGAATHRTMIAEIVAAKEMERRFIADAESDIAKEKLLDVRAALSARQSILNAETRRSI